MPRCVQLSHFAGTWTGRRTLKSSLRRSRERPNWLSLAAPPAVEGTRGSRTRGIRLLPRAVVFKHKPARHYECMDTPHPSPNSQMLYFALGTVFPFRPLGSRQVFTSNRSIQVRVPARLARPRAKLVHDRGASRSGQQLCPRRLALLWAGSSAVDELVKQNGRPTMLAECGLRRRSRPGTSTLPRRPPTRCRRRRGGATLLCVTVHAQRGSRHPYHGE